MMHDKTELETHYGNAAASHLHTLENGTSFIAVPRNYELQSVEGLLSAPSRIKEAVKVLTAQSFIKYFNQFSNDDSLIVMNDGNQTITGKLDYHNIDVPSWCSHTVTYTCPKSREWELWNRYNRNKFSQLEFAEFIEENIKDFSKPDGGQLLAIATQFSVTRTSVFSSGVRLASGEFQFQFSEENQNKGTVEVPEKFSIGIAPFHNGEAYRIEARLRYRIREGKLTIWYELIEPEKVLEDAFNGVKEVIRNGIDNVLTIDAAA